MSRIYFHSESGDAEVLGCERYHACWLKDQLGFSVLRLSDAFGRSWLLDHLDPPLSHSEQVLIQRGVGRSLLEDRALVVPDGRRFSVSHVVYNSALRVGSRPVRFMVRLHAQCEIHLWVSGPNRKWLAGVIEEGRRDGVMRPGMGWEEVVALLLARDDEPVVTSYSVTRQFPNPDVAEWEGDEADENGDEEAAWHRLPLTERWAMAMNALAKDNPLLELRPDNFDTYWFGLNMDAFKIEEIEGAEGVVKREERLREAKAKGELPSILDL